MDNLLDRYFSFRGRLSRLPFFIRGLYVNIAAAVLFVPSIPLFSNGIRLWWWAGLAVVFVSLGVLALGIVSLTVRRLHDLGLAGYHVVWIAVAETGSTALSYGPARVALLGLPLAAVGLWLTFWPGNAKANRFGDAPA